MNAGLYEVFWWNLANIRIQALSLLLLWGVETKVPGV
jgi:hypothetical protein